MKTYKGNPNRMCAKRQTNKSPLVGVVQKLQTFVDVQKSTLEILWKIHYG